MQLYVYTICTIIFTCMCECARACSRVIAVSLSNFLFTVSCFSNLCDHPGPLIFGLKTMKPVDKNLCPDVSLF